MARRWMHNRRPLPKPVQRVYGEKQSGVKTDRAALARCLASLEAGDALLVTKLDRLARATRDLLNTLAAIGEAWGKLQVAGRWMGRYHDPAWEADANGPWRGCLS